MDPPLNMSIQRRGNATDENKHNKFMIIPRSLALASWLFTGACSVLLQLCGLIYCCVSVCVFSYRIFSNSWCLLVVVALLGLALVSMKLSLATSHLISKWFLLLDPTKVCWGHSHVVTYLRTLIFHNAFLAVYVVCYFGVQLLTLSKLKANGTSIWFYEYVMKLAFWLGWCTVALIIFFVPSFCYYWASVGYTNPYLWTNETSNNTNETNNMNTSSDHSEIAKSGGLALKVLETSTIYGGSFWYFHFQYWILWLAAAIYLDNKKSLGDLKGRFPVLSVLCFYLVLPVAFIMTTKRYLSKWFLVLIPAGVHFNHECITSLLSYLGSHCLFLPMYVFCYYYCQHLLLLGLVGQKGMIRVFRFLMYYGLSFGVSTIVIICATIPSFCYFWACVGCTNPRFWRGARQVSADASDLEMQEPLPLSDGAIQTSTN